MSNKCILWKNIYNKNILINITFIPLFKITEVIVNDFKCIFRGEYYKMQEMERFGDKTNFISKSLHLYVQLKP